MVIRFRSDDEDVAEGRGHSRGADSDGASEGASDREDQDEDQDLDVDDVDDMDDSAPNYSPSEAISSGAEEELSDDGDDEGDGDEDGVVRATTKRNLESMMSKQEGQQPQQKGHRDIQHQNPHHQPRNRRGRNAMIIDSSGESSDQGGDHMGADEDRDAHQRRQLQPPAPSATASAAHRPGLVPVHKRQRTRCMSDLVQDVSGKDRGLSGTPTGTSLGTGAGQGAGPVDAGGQSGSYRLRSSGKQARSRSLPVSVEGWCSSVIYGFVQQHATPALLQWVEASALYSFMTTCCSQ